MKLSELKSKLLSQRDVTSLVIEGELAQIEESIAAKELDALRERRQSHRDPMDKPFWFLGMSLESRRKRRKKLAKWFENHRNSRKLKEKELDHE